jgi:nitrogen fixation NifU-like protein
MSGMDDLYRENILDHYKHPRNRGTLEHPDISYEDANPLCGDKIRMDFNIRDGKIEAVRFSGSGCSISQAAASMLCEEIEGKSLDEVKKLSRDDVLEMLGIELGPVEEDDDLADGSRTTDPGGMPAANGRREEHR